MWDLGAVSNTEIEKKESLADLHTIQNELALNKKDEQKIT